MQSGRKTTELILPYPPTANKYYRSVMINGSLRMLISAKGISYRESVYALCLDVKNDFQWPLTGRLGVKVVLRRKDRRSYDIDNFVKALLDSLEHAGVFENDSQIDQLHIIRGPVVSDGSCEVLIKELE